MQHRAFNKHLAAVRQFLLVVNLQKSCQLGRRHKIKLKHAEQCRAHKQQLFLVLSSQMWSSADMNRSGTQLLRLPMRRQGSSKILVALLLFVWVPVLSLLKHLQ